MTVRPDLDLHTRMRIDLARLNPFTAGVHHGQIVLSLRLAELSKFLELLKRAGEVALMVGAVR